MTQRKYEPPPRISCGGCTAAWTGASRAHCSGCHITWSSVTLFDKHRRYSKCARPNEILEKGEPLRLVGGVWSAPEADEATRERLRAARGA